MKSHSRNSPAPKRQRELWFSCAIVAAVSLIAGLWWMTGDRRIAEASRQGASVRRALNVSQPRKADGVEKAEIGGSGRAENAGSGSQRQPLQFRAKPVELAAVLSILASGKQTVDERVRQVQGMRGIVLSSEERESALAFFAGKQVPDGMGKGSMQWLADELLTVLRLQDPPWDGLAAELAEVAFQPDTDPVVRDYIMQHLGHLWEQYGARKEIDAALWRAVKTDDETTPGTALIALSRGYQRDQQQNSLTAVQQRAFNLAVDSNSPLAVRVTALSIAGEGGGTAVEALADMLIKDPATAVILRNVAMRVAR